MPGHGCGCNFRPCCTAFVLVAHRTFGSPGLVVEPIRNTVSPSHQQQTFAPERRTAEGGTKVYVDEAGGPEPEDHTQEETDDGQLTVTVDGEDYHGAPTEDMNQDGSNETILQKTEYGYDQFSDSDGDGQADLYVERDESGKVVSAAEFDPATGDWHAVDPETGEPTGGGGSEDTDTSGGDTQGGGDMTVDTRDGETNVGAPTIDSDGDGTKDTAVVKGADGSTAIYTDSNGDGQADLEQKIDAQGNVVISQHTGDGEWREVERGRIDEKGEYVPSGGAGAGASSDQLWGGGETTGTEGVARIDSTTGQWISNN